MGDKGTAAKEAILKQALRLFATKGYQETSIQNVADAVGISQSAVLYHFGSKKALFAGVLSMMTARNEAIRGELAPGPEASAYDRLMAHFEVNYRWGIEADFHAQIMTCLFHFASFDAEFSTLYREVLTNARKKITELVYAGVREKIFQAPDGDPELAGEILHDGLLGFVLTMVTTGRVTSKQRLKLKWQVLLREVLQPQGISNKASSARKPI